MEARFLKARPLVRCGRHYYMQDKHKIHANILTTLLLTTSGYATWFTAGGAIRIAHYDVIDDVITRKL